MGSTGDILWHTFYIHKNVTIPRQHNRLWWIYDTLSWTNLWHRNEFRNGHASLGRWWKNTVKSNKSAMKAIRKSECIQFYMYFQSECHQCGEYEWNFKRFGRFWHSDDDFNGFSTDFRYNLCRLFQSIGHPANNSHSSVTFQIANAPGNRLVWYC